MRKVLEGFLWLRDRLKKLLKLENFWMPRMDLKREKVFNKKVLLRVLRNV
jgi:hypothetical protein